MTFRGKIVERYGDMTRFGARMEAAGLNSTLARGARKVQSGGPFTAPRYESVDAYATARQRQL